MTNDLTCFQRTVFSLLPLISALFCQTPEGQAEAELSADNAVAVWDANGAPNPLAFSFVVHENGIPFLLLSRAGGNFDSSATPELLGEFGRAFRALSDPREQLDWSTWQDRPVVLFGTTTRCNATVRTIGQLVRFTGGWDDLVMTGAAPADMSAVNETRLAELTFLSSNSETYIAAKIEPDPGEDCSSTLWGRAEKLSMPNVTIPVAADSETAKTLERLLRRSNAWSETQKEFDDAPPLGVREINAHQIPSRWETYFPKSDGMIARTFDFNIKTSIAWANQSGGDGPCGFFDGSVTGIWIRAQDGQTWTPAHVPVKMDFASTPVVALNLDDSELPQIIFENEDDLSLYRFSDGTFKPSISLRIHYHGCGC